MQRHLTDDTPYRPPSVLDTSLPESVCEEMEAIAVTPLVKAAALTVMSVSLLSFLAGIQLLVIVRVVGPFAFVPWVFLLMSPVGIIPGKQLFQMRRPGAIIGVVLSAVMTVGATGWMFFSMRHGLLLLLQGILPLLSLAATVLCVLALAPTGRADATRAHYARQGIEMNF